MRRRARSRESRGERRPRRSCARPSLREFGKRHENQRQADREERQAHRFRIAARRLQRRVDGERQGARFAFDVGNEGDDRAELAEAGGEGGNDAGGDAGQRQRQRNVEHPVPPRRTQRLRRLLQAGIDRLQRQADGTHLEGEGDDRRGQRRAGPAEDEADAEGMQQPAAQRAARAERRQKEEADRDGRQPQGHMDQAVDQRLAREPCAGQQEGGCEGQGERREGRDTGDPQGQQQRLALRRRQDRVHAAMTGKLQRPYIGLLPGGPSLDAPSPSATVAGGGHVIRANPAVAALAVLVLCGAAGELPPPTASPPAPTYGPQSYYVVRYDHWTPADERGFGEFITAIGDSGCRTVDDCLHGPGNPFRASDPEGVYFRSDCADLPYTLRFYYAWKRGLPFAYVSAVEPRGHTRDVRYTARGNAVAERTTVAGGAVSGYAVFDTLRDTISSATYRIHPDLEEPLEQDFYSPAIQPGSIRPGTVIYDPN